MRDSDQFESALSREAFGAALARLRGNKSLRDLEREGPFSKSQLHRWEVGRSAPPIEYAKSLDEIYAGNGWVAVAIRNLSRRTWDPWVELQTPDIHHAHIWPAPFSGVVWVKVVPRPEDLGVRFQARLAWGPWRRTVVFAGVAAGTIMLTGKAVDLDGIARTMNLTLDRPAFTLAGTGSPGSDETVVDIRTGWTAATAENTDPESDHGPSGAGQ